MSKEVVIYGRKACAQCSQVKLFLRLNDVVFEEKDIDMDEDALAEVMTAKQELGISTLPFIKVNGDFLPHSGVEATRIHKEKICS